MELISNLFIRCYPVGFLYEWYSVSERSKTDIISC